MTKIALIENCGSDFYNYRVLLAKFLEGAGYEVYAVVSEDEGMFVNNKNFWLTNS